MYKKLVFDEYDVLVAYQNYLTDFDEFMIDHEMNVSVLHVVFYLFIYCCNHSANFGVGKIN